MKSSGYSDYFQKLGSLRKKGEKLGATQSARGIGNTGGGVTGPNGTALADGCPFPRPKDRAGREEAPGHNASGQRPPTLKEKNGKFEGNG